jgi:hypothetical protein
MSWRGCKYTRRKCSSEHRIGGMRGFGPERKVRIRKDEAGKVTEWDTSFHMM